MSTPEERSRALAQFVVEWVFLHPEFSRLVGDEKVTITQAIIDEWLVSNQMRLAPRIGSVS